MIGIIEIIFSVIMFCVIWFMVFKIKLRFDDSKRLKNIVEKIEKQDKKYFTDGKEINLIEELELKKTPVRIPVKKEKRKRRFFFFKRKKKKEKELEKLKEIKKQVPEVKEEKPKEKPKKDRREELRTNLKEELRDRINKK